MDYKAFYEDIVDWIGQANQAASQHGMHSEEFWACVSRSVGEICSKYQDNRLVLKQMTMLVEWLEEMYEKARGSHEAD